MVYLKFVMTLTQKRQIMKKESTFIKYRGFNNLLLNIVRILNFIVHRIKVFCNKDE